MFYAQRISVQDSAAISASLLSICFTVCHNTFLLMELTAITVNSNLQIFQPYAHYQVLLICHATAVKYLSDQKQFQNKRFILSFGNTNCL